MKLGIASSLCALGALMVLALGAACSCGASGKRSPPEVSPPVGDGGDAAVCGGQRAHIEALYRAEAQAGPADRVEEAVRDNTAMVLAECAERSEVARCAASAADARALESRCLLPLSDDGTEAARLPL